jgi:hypothetical protein
MLSPDVQIFTNSEGKRFKCFEATQILGKVWLIKSGYKKCLDPECFKKGLDIFKFNNVSNRWESLNFS